MQKHWQISQRVTHFQQPIFKLKQIEPEVFIHHIPKKGQIHTLDLGFTPVRQQHKFSSQIQAIEYFEWKGETYLAAGCEDGAIELYSIGSQWTHRLKPEAAIGSQQRLINDLLFLPQSNKLVNCFNNGHLALWSLNQTQLSSTPQSYKKIHDSFTYKIRLMDNQTLLTCSHDYSAALVDVENTTVISYFHHPESVWCAYPLDSNVFCSSGLMNSLTFWDSRQHRIISRCQLENQQTSYITRLNASNLIFGDQRQLCTCDLRKLIKQPFGNTRMRQSAESIIVLDDAVIVAGRGGDLCKFINSEQQVQIDDKSIGVPGISMAMMQIMQNMGLNQHFQLFGAGQIEGEHLEIDLNEEMDAEWEVESQDEPIAVHHINIGEEEQNQQINQQMGLGQEQQEANEFSSEENWEDVEDENGVKKQKLLKFTLFYQMAVILIYQMAVILICWIADVQGLLPLA